MFKKFISTYTKCIGVVFKSSRFYSLLLLLIIPAQALMPSLLIYSSNAILNTVSQNNANIISLLVLWAFAFLLSNILHPLYTTIQGFLTDKLTLHLNISLMNTAKNIPDIAIFEDSKFYDDIEILSQEIGWRPVNLLVFGAGLLGNLITAISMLVILSQFSIIISVLMFIAIIPQSIVYYKIQQESFEVLVSNTPDSRKLNYYTEVLLTRERIKDVKLFDLYDFFINKYKKTFRNINKSVRANRVKKLFISLIFLLITTAISFFVFYLVIAGTLSGVYLVGSILVFSSSILYTTQSISQFVENSSMLYDTLLFMQKYFSFISLHKTYHDGSTNFKKDFSCISFSNVSFKYPNNETNALTNITFSVDNGEKIAIVGENGSGKTTLMKLLCRFYKPLDGQIKLDNISIENFLLKDYRKNIGAVFQDYSKFDLTLRENIAISNLKDITNDDKLKSVLAQAEFEQRDNLDTLLGIHFEGGKDLSGGQWQKLAIARAFFGNFEIVILDEPTASIDPRSEYEIYKSFLQLTKNKTVFFVTHRLSMVKNADKVLVLRDGHIIGFDTHETLMQNNSYYNELYTMQASQFIDE